MPTKRTLSTLGSDPDMDTSPTIQSLYFINALPAHSPARVYVGV